MGLSLTMPLLPFCFPVPREVVVNGPMSLTYMGDGRCSVAVACGGVWKWKVCGRQEACRSFVFGEPTGDVVAAVAVASLLPAVAVAVVPGVPSSSFVVAEPRPWFA